MNQLKNTKVSSAPKTSMPVKSVSVKSTSEKGVEKKVKKNVVDKSEKSKPGVDKKIEDKIAMLDKDKSKIITDKGNTKTTNGITDKNKKVKTSDKNVTDKSAPEKGALDNDIAEKSEKPDKETLIKMLMKKLNPDYDVITDDDWPAKTVHMPEIYKPCEDDEPKNPFGQVLLLCCCPDDNNNIDKAVKNGEVHNMLNLNHYTLSQVSSYKRRPVLSCG